MKKSFTLVELLLSILLFSIIMIFLFETLNFSKKSVEFFDKKIGLIDKSFEVKELISNDFLYSKTDSIKLYQDKNNNIVLNLETKNNLYNPTFNKISYFITKEKNLLRIESSKHFNKSNNDILTLEKSYITKILHSVNFFRVSKIAAREDAYALYIKKEDEKEYLFTVFSLNLN